MSEPRHQPGEETYHQVLRATAATAGAVTAFILFLMGLRLVGSLLPDARAAGATALPALLLAGWAMMECVFAAADMRTLPPSGEHRALQVALIVMFAADLASAVALGALAVTLLSSG